MGTIIRSILERLQTQPSYWIIVKITDLIKRACWLLTVKCQHGAIGELSLGRPRRGAESTVGVTHTRSPAAPHPRTPAPAAPSHTRTLATPDPSAPKHTTTPTGILHDYRQPGFQIPISKA